MASLEFQIFHRSEFLFHFRQEIEIQIGSIDCLCIVLFIKSFLDQSLLTLASARKFNIHKKKQTRDMGSLKIRFSQLLSPFYPTDAGL